MASRDCDIRVVSSLLHLSLLREFKDLTKTMRNNSAQYKNNFLLLRDSLATAMVGVRGSGSGSEHRFFFLEENLSPVFGDNF